MAVLALTPHRKPKTNKVPAIALISRHKEKSVNRGFISQCQKADDKTKTVHFLQQPYRQKPKIELSGLFVPLFP